MTNFKKMLKKVVPRVALLVCFTTVLFSACVTNSTSNWQDKLDAALPEYGHRNWIVIADYAYPSQSAPGIETIATGQTQTEVLSYVLDKIENAPHVKPLVMFDKELESVSEEDAPGVEVYRAELKKVVQGKSVSVMPHEDIIKRLDDGARMFNILILKTNMTIPYTSVFLNLDCDYWDAEKEKRLRRIIANSEK